MRTFVYKESELKKVYASAIQQMEEWKRKRGYLERDLVRIFIANALERICGRRWSATIVDSIMADMLWNALILQKGEYFEINSL